MTSGLALGVVHSRDFDKWTSIQHYIPAMNSFSASYSLKMAYMCPLKVCGLEADFQCGSVRGSGISDEVLWEVFKSMKRGALGWN